MAKTEQDYLNFIEDIKKLCEKHRIGMAGTDSNECSPRMSFDIYGEITLFDMDRPEDAGWRNVEEHVFNFEIPKDMT